MPRGHLILSRGCIFLYFTNVLLFGAGQACLRSYCREGRERSHSATIVGPDVLLVRFWKAFVSPTGASTALRPVDGKTEPVIHCIRIRSTDCALETGPSLLEISLETSIAFCICLASPSSSHKTLRSSQVLK